MELITVILVLWVGYLTFRLTKQSQDLERIEKTLAKFRVVKKSGSQKHAEPAEKEVSDHATDAPEHKEQPATVQEEYEPGMPLEQILIKRVLPTVGVLSVILGVGYFVTWSYTNNWIGPGTLIAMGALFSAVLVGVGEYTRERYERYYAFFSASGMLGLAVCVFASHQVYGFVGDALAFSSYCVIILSSFGFALRYMNRSLSFLSGAGSFIVPFLVQSVEPNYYVLMAYSALVFAGGALIMRYRSWTETGIVTFAAFVIYAALVLDGISSASVSPVVYMGWMYLSIAGFIAAVLMSALENREQEKNASMGMLSLSLAALTVVNIYAYQAFSLLDWPHFGFFVLLQAAGMYAFSVYLTSRDEEQYASLFVIGSVALTIFAILYEVDYTVYPLLQSLLLAAFSVILMTAQSHSEGYSKNMFFVGALIAQVLSFVGLCSIENDFLNLSVGLAVSTLLALYNARMIYESAGESMRVWMYVELALAVTLFLIWNFGLLPDELGGDVQSIVPYAITLVAVVGMMMLYWVKRYQYPAIVAMLLGVCGSLSFVLHDFVPQGGTLFGFVAVALSLYLPLGVMEYLRSENQESVDEHLYQRTVTFASVSLGIVLSWFGFWWFSEPFSTLFMLIVGITMVFFGLMREHNNTRMVGLVIVGLVVAKLYLIDIWSWSTFWKFVALVPVGIVLISLPFWYQKLTSSKE